MCHSVVFSTLNIVKGIVANRWSGDSILRNCVDVPRVQIVRKRSKSLDFQKTETLQRSKSLDLQKIESLLLLSSQPIEVAVSRPIVLREGIVWDVSSPASPSGCGVDAGLSARAQSLGNSAVSTAPPLPSRVVKNTSYEEWDPLLKLKIRDAVVSDGVSSFSVKDFTFPLAPVAIQGSGIAVLGNDVVRVWDSDTRSLMKCVRLPKGNDAVTAFDVNWGLEALAMTRKGGLVSLVNLESAAHANCYETQQPVWQAVHLNSSPFSNILFTGQFSAFAMAFMSFSPFCNTFFLQTLRRHKYPLRLTCVHALSLSFFRRTSSCESRLFCCSLGQQIKQKRVNPRPSFRTLHLRYHFTNPGASCQRRTQLPRCLRHENAQRVHIPAQITMRGDPFQHSRRQMVGHGHHFGRSR